MELPVLNIQGQDTGRKVNLSEEVFCIEPNDHVVYLATRQYMANKRRGTHKTIGKGELSGSTKKLRKQKGSGHARVGSIKSPLFRGGARVFGPSPRDYSFKLNSRVKELARKSALSYKTKDNKLVVLEDFSFDSPKTKNFVQMLSNLKMSKNKILLILPVKDQNIRLSQRNLQDSKVVTVDDISTYDILSANYLLISESSIPKIESMFGQEQIEKPENNIGNQTDSVDITKIKGVKKSIKPEKTLKVKKSKKEEIGA